MFTVQHLSSYSLPPALISRSFVSIMPTHAATVNGIKANGKIKSKNQLRRLKAKQKKAEAETVKVCISRRRTYDLASKY